MTLKQLQSLISAGVFSAALLSGVAYAEDMSTKPTDAATTMAPVESKKKMHKMKHKKAKVKKDMAMKHDCAGKNTCKGQGGCATDGSKGHPKMDSMSQHACKGMNACKGQGGCGS